MSSIEHKARKRLESHIPREDGKNCGNCRHFDEVMVVLGNYGRGACGIRSGTLGTITISLPVDCIDYCDNHEAIDGAMTRELFLSRAAFAVVAENVTGAGCSDIRCPACGAKTVTHAKDHLCRMHRDDRGICTVCRDPYKYCRHFISKEPCLGMEPGVCPIECPGNDHF